MSRNKVIAIVMVIGLVISVAAVIWEAKTGYDLDKQFQSQVTQHLRENARLRYIQQLSIEFSFDPKIIMTVDQLAAEYVKPDELGYRLLSREFFTYLFLSLIWAESTGDPATIGDGGKGFGLTQLWLDTARQYDEEMAEAKLLTVQANLSIAFKHADYLLRKYRGNIALCLYRWNRGETTVDNLLHYGLSVENGYARTVYEAAELNNWRLNWG